MTALRSCERQSGRYSPTAQASFKQESERPFGGLPFRSPVPAGEQSYFCQPRLYQDLLNYLQYNAFFRYVKEKIKKIRNFLTIYINLRKKAEKNILF